MSKTLVSELARLQQDRGWSDREMAAAMGISRSMWSHVKAGRRGMGPEVLVGIVKAFPWIDIKFYLAQKDDNSTQNVTVMDAEAPSGAPEPRSEPDEGPDTCGAGNGAPGANVEDTDAAA